MNSCIRKLVLTAVCIGSSGAALAGGVTVRYVHPEQFSDMPVPVSDRERALGEISAHFSKLGQALPPSQELAVEVLDVDLAGHTVPNGHGEEVRVLNKHDLAHMHLRYTLSEQGKVIRSGDMNISDFKAPEELLSKRPANNLPREKLMIDLWWHANIQGNELTQR
jgi:hypothetical protein